VTRTPWRKMHLAIDPDLNIHAIEITGTDVSDSEGMDRILPMDLPIEWGIADGAYYRIERGEALSDRGILFITSLFALRYASPSNGAEAAGYMITRTNEVASAASTNACDPQGQKGMSSWVMDRVHKLSLRTQSLTLSNTEARCVETRAYVHLPARLQPDHTIASA
jgi:hypothetical protein